MKKVSNTIKIKNIIKHSFLFLMVIANLICILSLTIKASAVLLEDTTNLENIIFTNFLDEVEEKSKSLSVFEIESLREETTKHFRLEDGSYRAISYGKVIHQKDEYGYWIDIDNTLSLNNGYYITHNNRNKFSSCISTSDPLYQINEKDYSISWSISSTQRINNVIAEVNNNKDYYENIKEKTIEVLTNANNNSNIKYSNIISGLSLEYSLEFDKVNSKIHIDDITKLVNISFIVDVSNVIVNKDQNGDLVFSDKNNNELVRYVKPDVKTLENKFIGNINYVVTAAGKNKYVVSFDVSNLILLESSSSNNAKVAPGIFIEIVDGSGGGTTESLFDTYISSTNPTTRYGSEEYIKVSNSSETGMIKIYTPDIPDGSTITNAFIRVSYYFSASSSKYMYLGAYEIIDSWSENSVYYNDNLNISSELLSSTYVHATATATNNEFATIGITEAAKSWYAGTTYNNGIAIKYKNGTGDMVYINSKESENNEPTLTVDYEMIDLIVEEGEYFIKNVELEKYVQIDDNDSSNNYNTQGAILELWDFSGDNYQKWTFEYLHNGYYKIKSSESGKVISVAVGNEDASNDALIQQSYTGSERQQWKIILSDEGQFILKARSSESHNPDRVMCAGDGIGSNGRNVEQREYSDNNIYKDEWVIELTNYDTSLFALKEGNINRNVFFEETIDLYTMYRSSDIYTEVFSEYNVDGMLYRIQHSKIFYIHTHGLKDKILIGSLNITMNNIANIDLNQTEFILLMTCLNGEGGYSQTRVNNNQPINIVEQFICSGVECVLGFSESTYVRDCNILGVDLTELLLEDGLSVVMAINSIDYTSYIDDMSSYAVIGGNQNKTIN